MKSTVIAVDVAKSVFQIAVSRHPGKIAESHRLPRSKFLHFFAQRRPALVLLEACGTAHHWGRQIEGLGHQVLLLPPHLTRAYIQRGKTDAADAKALLEAYRNDQIRPVPIKSVAQQTLVALHRLRSAWMADRTARINLLRGLLRELGFFLPVGTRHILRDAWSLIEDAESTLPDALRLALAETCLEIRDFEQRICAIERQLQILAGQMTVIQRLRSIPGIGLLTATALVAIVGDIFRFPTGRHFASFLGLTPREHSSGLRRRLGSISKSGDAYLRTLLVNGSRAVLLAAKRMKRLDRFRSWALGVEKHRGHNKAAVAVANKLARIIWTVWRNEKIFEFQPLALGEVAG